MQFILEPYRHGHPKAGKSLRDIGQIGFQQAFELGQRLFIKRDIVEITWRESPLFQAEVDRMRGKSGIMFDPGKPFFLRRSHDPAIYHKSGCAIVIKRGDPQDRCHAFPPVFGSVLDVPVRL